MVGEMLPLLIDPKVTAITEDTNKLKHAGNTMHQLYEEMSK